jgi:CBS domain-containing protein
MRAGEAMTRDVRVVWPDHTVEEAARVTLTIDVGTPLVTQLDAPQSCNGPGLR